MRKPKNPVIGHWTCPLGGRAEVRQATKRGRHFYSTCDCCGVQMGTAAARQSKIWKEAEFSPPPGVNVFKPTNVTDDGEGLPAPTEAAEPATEAVQGGSGEAGDRWKPGDGEPAEADGEAEPQSGESGKSGALVALGVATLAVIGGLWMS